MVQVRDFNFASVTFDHELKKFFCGQEFCGFRDTLLIRTLHEILFTQYSVIGCLAAILRLSDGLFRAAGAETYAEGDMRRAQMRGYWRLLSWYQVGGWCVWILGVWPR